MQFIPYIVISLIAILFGQAVAHINKKIPPLVSEEIKYKEFFKSLKTDFKVDVKYTLIFLIIFNFLIYFLGNNITTYLYTIIIFSLAMVFSVDYRFELIPDECHYIILFSGIINFFLNLSLWWDYLFGAIIGGAIFWGLGGLALIIFKKEGMGFGDVKLMAALGFMFGIKNILVISLVSFFIGAIIGGLLLIFRKKEATSYIPFGPFIVAATVILMFIGPDYLIEMYLMLCGLLSTKMTDLIYYISNK